VKVFLTEKCLLEYDAVLFLPKAKPFRFGIVCAPIFVELITSDFTMDV
jgi:hypothetical protein